MPTSYISRADAAALIIEERSSEILQAAAEASVALSSFRRVNVGTSVLRYNILDTLPNAQWLSVPQGQDVDVAKKPTTTMSWDSATVSVEEAATIVVIPENVLDDSTVDLWGEVRTRAVEAIGRLVDKTVFFGQAPDGSAVPAAFPVGGLVGRAIAAGNTFKSTDDIVMDWAETMELVENDGYDVQRAFAGPQLKGVFRTATNAQGQPILANNFTSDSAVAPFGVPVSYASRGIWDNTKALALMGDPQLAWIVMRQDITVKMLDQATVGDINLAEQDALAMRLKIRMGFTTVAPKMPGAPANAFPFAILAPKTP
ncbi:phage major capsid protein [Kribbella sp. NPDC056861]|uniref:phage major capsid protein n=1 Tax=Kribbella sp. NPDC056861 TaxID=3154857 RepID=UPI0034407CAF